jgi:hypothetical protein
VKLVQAMAVVLATACADDDAPSCDETCSFACPTPLVEGLAWPEIGTSDVLVVTQSEADQPEDRRPELAVHGFDGQAQGRTVELPTAGGPWGVGALDEGGGWTILWPPGDGTLRVAAVTADGVLSEEGVWREEVEGDPVVRALVRTSAGLAAVWNNHVTGDLFLGVGAAVVPLGRGNDPAFAVGDGELGLAWADEVDDQLRFVRVSPDGEVIADPITIGPIEYDPSPGICFEGGAYFIAHKIGSGGTGDVYLTRIADDAVGEPILVSDGGGESFRPAVACSEGVVGVVWQDNLPGNVAGTDLTLSQIEFAAVLPGADDATDPIVVEPSTEGLAALARLAADGDGGFRVAWVDYGPSGYRTQLSSIDRCAWAND